MITRIPHRTPATLSFRGGALAAFAASITLLATAPVSATPEERNPSANRGASNGDTGAVYYDFDDDRLDAAAYGSIGTMLHVRLGPIRTLLIRPRVQFVGELVTSIEQM